MEHWKPVTDFEGLYEVSSLGRVRSLDRKVRGCRGSAITKFGKVLTPVPDKEGYLIVSLCAEGVKRKAKVHRLVAKHFLPPFSGPEVNHSDLNKANNTVANLEWSTRKDNMEHAKAHGRFAAVTNPACARKLTLEGARSLRADRKAGMTLAKLAAKYGISWQTAHGVVNGTYWVE